MARILALTLGAALVLAVLGWLALAPGPGASGEEAAVQRGGPGRAVAPDGGGPGQVPGVSDGDAEARRAAAHGSPDVMGAGREGARAAMAADLVCTVVDRASGAPIQGAQVQATTAELGAPLGLGVVEGGVLGTTSDGDGRAVLRSEPGGARLQPGRDVQILVRRPGFAPSRAGSGRPIPRRPPLDLGRIPLDPGLHLSGRVTGPDGSPVPGASISFGQPDRTGLMERVVRTRGLAAEPTDSEGRYAIDELEQGPFWVIVDAPGFPLERREGVIEPGRGAGFDIRLARGTPIAGKIDGAPDGMALVVIAAATGDEASDLERRGVVMGVSAVDGAFRGERMRLGQDYRLTTMVQRPTGQDPAGQGPAGQGLSRARAVEQVTVPAGTTDVVLIWRERTRIAGRVMAPGGPGDGLRPVTDFMVAWANGAPEGIDFDARTFEGASGEPLRRFDDGRFAFDSLDEQRGGGRDRKMTLRVRALGHDDLFVRGIAVPAGQTTELGELVLTPGDVLRVQVVDDADGEPVPDARVYCTSAEGDRWLGWWRRRDVAAWTSDTVRFGETDRIGIAVIPRPPGGQALKLGVNGDGYVPSEVETVDVPEGATDILTVKLKRGGQVLVRVRDRDGTPSIGQRVQLTLDDGFIRGERSVSAQTDGEGEARFMAVPAGPARVRLRLPSMRPRRPPSWEAAASARIAVPASGEVAVDLEPWPLARVDGAVMEAGRPMVGARISFDLVDGDTTFRPQYESTELRAISASDGSFRLPRVPSGRYSVAVAHRSRAMLGRFEVDVSRGMGTLRLDLPEAAVAGRVVDRRRGEPLEGLRVQIFGPRGQDQAWIGVREYRERPDGSLDADDDWESPSRTRTAADGTFSFRGVAVGQPIVVSVEGRFIRSQRQSLRPLAAGESREGVLLRAPAAGAIQARISGLDNRRWRRERRQILVRVSRLGPDGEPGGLERDRSGGLRPIFGSLPPGEYRVQLERRQDGQPNLVLSSQGVSVEAGKQVTVELVAK